MNNTVVLGLVWLGGCTPGVDFEVELAQLEEAMAGYPSWDRLDAWPGIEPSDAAHGAYSEIWVDAATLSTIEAADGAELPVGATRVKQVWGDAAGTERQNLAGVTKLDTGAWFYAAWDPDGALVVAGQPPSCAGCHDDGQDSVMVVRW